MIKIKKKLVNSDNWTLNYSVTHIGLFTVHLRHFDNVCIYLSALDGTTCKCGNGNIFGGWEKQVSDSWMKVFPKKSLPKSKKHVECHKQNCAYKCG